MLRGRSGMWNVKSPSFASVTGFFIFRQSLKVHSRLKSPPQRIQTEAHTVGLATKKCFSDSLNKLKQHF